jgi:hypothetical protein
LAGGYLLIGRQNNTAGLPGADRPTIALDIDELHVRYRGIEGEPWPNRPAKLSEHLVEGLLTARSLEPAKKYYDMVAAECLCDLLYIESFTHSGGETELPREFVLLGFDFGFFRVSDDFTASRSRIYSEVLFGEHEDLREMAGELNDNLLFGDHRTLKNFGRTVTRMMSTGNFAMNEADIGQGFSIYGLPSEKRKITRKYFELPSFIE